MFHSVLAVVINISNSQKTLRSQYTTNYYSHVNKVSQVGVKLGFVADENFDVCTECSPLFKIFICQYC